MAAQNIRVEILIIFMEFDKMNLMECNKMNIFSHF